RIKRCKESIERRIVLVTEINVAGSTLITYNLHLESRANDELRLSQLDEVLSDAARYDPHCFAVMAGDLNLNVSKNAAAESLARAEVRNHIKASPTPTTPSP